MTDDSWKSKGPEWKSADLSDPDGDETENDNDENNAEESVFRFRGKEKKKKTTGNNEVYSDSGGSSNGGVTGDHIGTGENAKTNVIWNIISITLIIFSCISVSIIICMIYGFQMGVVIDQIKDIWSIFTPIITLSLGYLFGRREGVKGSNNEDY